MKIKCVTVRILLTIFPDKMKTCTFHITITKSALRCDMLGKRYNISAKWNTRMIPAKNYEDTFKSVKTVWNYLD